MDAQRERDYEIAKKLRQRGQLEAAIAVYKRYRDIDSAARTLLTANRFTDAANLLLEDLNVRDDQLPSLTEAEKKQASKAAICFAKGGDYQRGVKILMAVGDYLNAVSMLEKVGDHTGAARLKAEIDARARAKARHGLVQGKKGAAEALERQGNLAGALRVFVNMRDYANAGRLAFRLGKPSDAGHLWEQAGMPYESGAAFKEASEYEKSLQMLMQVERGDPNYRKAAVLAIAVTIKLDLIEFELDHFLSMFVKSGPRSPRESSALYHLAKLYLAHEMRDAASEVLNSIETHQPGYRDVPLLITTVRSRQEESSASLEEAAREDARFRDVGRDIPDDGMRTASLPSLPPLGDDAEPTSGAAWQNAGEATVVQSPSGSGTMAGPAGAITEAKEEGKLGALSPGDVVSNRYEIQRELGRGGMAAVYQAYDRELDEAIALKFFFAGEATPDLVKRFKQELLLSRKLAHPNIVAVYDIGTHRGCKFMSMELLEGETLSQKIEDEIPLTDGLDYLIQACAGLQVAHTQGIVHRDIKPDNLFVTKSGVLKVMDFGIAKHQTGPAMTRAGFMAGTPEYIAPEQISSFASVTHAADIYAMGVVIFEVVTGKVPFTHSELMPLLQMHLSDEPPSLRTINPELPMALDMTVAQCLKKQPEERFESVEKLGKTLAALRKEMLP